MWSEFMDKLPVYSKTYRLARGYRIFFTIALLPLASLFLYSTIDWFQGARQDSVFLFVWALLPVFAGVMYYYLIWAHKWRVVVYPDYIEIVDVFKRKQIYFSNIKGIYILNTQYASTVKFVTTLMKPKSFSVWLGLDEADSFSRWAISSFVNLDEVECRQEMQRMLTEEDKFTAQEKLRRLANAKRFVRIMNVLSYVILLWLLIYPYPYKLAMWAMMVLPIIAALSLRYFSGLLLLDGGRKGSPYPSIAMPMVIAPTALIFRASFDIKVLDWQYVVVPALIISVILFVLLFLFDSEVRTRLFVLICTIAICVAYGGSATVIQNTILDTSQPVRYIATVENKHISDGSPPTLYYLQLSPWGSFHESREFDVDRAVYQSRRIGSSVNIYVFKGAYNIPWYVIE
jgi:hypothetical protein